MKKDFNFSYLDELDRIDAINYVKERFELCLENNLNLKKIPAPLFVEKNSGIQDDLNGVERPVEFEISSIKGKKFQIIHSLAKWKRLALKKLNIPNNKGIYTNMIALRPFEEIEKTELHSVYVDQLDWEKVISKRDRTLMFLKSTVEQIYDCLKKIEKESSKLLGYEAILPDKIEFIHTDDLFSQYKDLIPKQRENEIAKQYGAVFLIGIGGALANGEPHDKRAPGYDDWSTINEEGKKGLNGDIILFHPILNKAIEISSMGIRVDKDSLFKQLSLQNLENRLKLKWHKMLVSGELPQSIGGGIGVSRVLMFMLRAEHIGEVQVSEWPEEIMISYEKRGINFL